MGFNFPGNNNHRRRLVDPVVREAKIGGSMLEGKELDYKIGEYGAATVDVTPDLKLVVGVSLEVDLIAELKKLAVKTSTPIDDAAIAWVESMIRSEA